MNMIRPFTSRAISSLFALRAQEANRGLPRLRDFTTIRLWRIWLSSLLAGLCSAAFGPVKQKLKQRNLSDKAWQANRYDVR